jgi:phosphoglycolate phosphatase-like HAD superfamily hydrolase
MITKTLRSVSLSALLLVTAAACAAPTNVPPSTQPATDTSARRLASWNDGPTKTAIVDFVRKVTTPGSADFVPPPQRIAVFDNDGTLWSEQPTYVQLSFAVSQIKAMASSHPEWKDTQPFKAVLEGDMKTFAASGPAGIQQVLSASSSGMTTVEFADTVMKWMAANRNPRTNRPYTEMIYQPMVDVLGYLRANGFKTFIVSGGDVEFMRPWTERAYGIPPEQVVGSRNGLQYVLRGDTQVLMRLPNVELDNNDSGKVIGIHEQIGRRPIIAFGNSDGDLEMLQYTTSGPGARLGLLIHHTDAVREVAYDRNSAIGQLSRGLDEAPKRGWILVDMKNDWGVIFPPAQ